MPQKIIELYSEEEISRMRRRVGRCRAALIVLAAAALAVCAALAMLADAQNASRMEFAAVAVSTAAGWICIYFGIFVVSDGKKEVGHADMLRTEPRERIEGSVTVTDARFRIRNSIPVRRAEVVSEAGPKRVLVHESRAEKLAGLPVTAVYLAHGYVAAVEVEG